MANDVRFKTEASLWMWLERGLKTWDFRLWDMADDRIYALSFGRAKEAREQARPGVSVDEWEPEVETVSFENKETGEVLTFRYTGVRFAEWAPGWGFIVLGERVTQ